MDIGLVLALISALSFAIGIVIVRKTAGVAGESFSVMAISVFIGIPFFAIAILISGEWKNLLEISWKALVLLVSVGIIHFIIGRLLAYDSFRLIGANRSMPFTQTSPIYTIILSLSFLQEKLTGFITLGAVLMLTGAFLITREKKSLTGEQKKKLSRDEVKGILLALGAALCWGVTPVLIKPAVEETGSSVMGTFIAYAAAAIIMVFIIAKKERWHNLIKLPFKKSILPMIIAGMFTAAGQLLYFIALDKSPASVIAPLMSIQLLFIFILSFLINRKIELFSVKVALGMTAAIAGTVLLVQ